MVPADNISRPYASIYPRQYIAIRAPLSLTSSINQPATTIDGNLDKLFWNEVDWSEDLSILQLIPLPSLQQNLRLDGMMISYI